MGLVCRLHVLAAALAACALAQAPSDRGRLHPPISRNFALASGQIHLFHLSAGSGRFLRIVAEKRGIDLTLALLDPSGQEVAVSSNRSGPYGIESVAAVTGQSGLYAIKIAASGGLKLTGQYRITIEALRPPTDSDSLEVRARALLRQGLDGGGDPQPFAEAADRFGRLNQPYLQALALNRLGIACDDLREPDKALDAYNRALSIRRRSHDRSGEAATLANIAVISLKQGDKARALELLGQALQIRREIHDRAGEAGILFNIGLASGGRSALDSFTRALALSQSVGDRPRVALTLKLLGDKSYELDDKFKAVDFYERALAAYRELGDSKNEARMLTYAATTSSELGHPQKELEYHTQAAAIYHSLGDQANESAALDSIGTIYNQVLIDRAKALDFYNRALEIRRAAHDDQGISGSLNNIGTVYNSLGEISKAMEAFQPALALRRQLNDREGQAQTLGNIGSAYSLLGEKRKAVELYNQALAILRAAPKSAGAPSNSLGESRLLHNLGAVYADLGDRQQALDFLNQALAMERSLRNETGEASTLCNIGVIESETGDPQKALDLCNQAYSIEQAKGAAASAAHTLNVLGRIHSDQGNQQQALEFYNRALVAERANHDSGEEAATLHNIGHAYFLLGETAKAIDLYNQSLALFRAAGDRWHESRMLANLGILYADQKDTARALDCFTQARAIFQSDGDRAGEAGALDSRGVMYDNLGERQKAVESYTQALAIRRALGDRAGEAGTLNNLGAVYDALGEKPRALDLYQQALPILRAVGDRADEARTLSNLSMLFQDSQPDLAIVFGKQAVNMLQSVRRINRGLEDSLRRSYERSIESYYRNLAALLVSRQRFAEAEEVLSLLKDKEAAEFVQRDSISDELRSATLLEPEKAALARYDQLAGQVAALGQKKAALIAKSDTAPLTDAERAQSTQLDSDLGAANLVLQRFFDEQEKALAAGSGSARRIEEFRESESVQGALADLGPGVVAIYTLVTPGKYIAMLVTPGARQAYSTSIKETDLNSKIFEFRQKLQDPASDPLPLARELYGIVFPEGLRRDLESIQARTIMWSMDGALRYIPIAALHDGRDYLVMRFRNSLITPASMGNLQETPQARWQGLGFGVSQSKAGFPALPSVPAELHGIFRQSGNGAEPLAGSIRLDAEFTREAFLNDLRQPNHRVVHIATHFDSQPLAANSRLLLGDGQPWSLQEIRAVPRLFHGVDLLTLSACSTAFSNRSEDGREVDSFGTIAQQLGARSVIASLWSVSDEATARLMQTMYRFREENPAMGKSEALRQAQARLASGDLTPGARASSDRGVSPAHAPAAAPARDWRHPYYWAPFILIGNWK